ncbi:polysaccharide pyruvyl transferase CsaB [Paenibacillus camelliae]|uniref:polysaccharide pyruvyl transferase CsaB n=1 Tax=Paenibacillus camelliae TaxID=512410 RepID=UPI00203F5D2B|nr:polysaccharide pyruvyl transferase CsaB [Paenibacillus camelliae]MCM3635239.1 polysaccharide pyruvyl transferase CsaB [Paenibacillus camelliae]
MGMAEASTTFRVVISGYYGFKNSGDEAVLKSILLALEEQGKAAGITLAPVVLSGDPSWTSKKYGVEAVPRMHPASVWRAISSSDALISGGGSLLQDATGMKSIPYYTGIIKLAQWLRKPTFIYAQGIGPVHRQSMYAFIRSAMNKSQYVSVRDEQSSQFLSSIGVNTKIEIVPDPVMGMPLPEQRQQLLPEASGVQQIGISVRFWNKDRSDLQRIGEALIALTEQRNVMLTFLPFHLPDDIEASQFLIDQIQSRIGAGSSIKLMDLPDDPMLMLQAVSECDALFGMRLHALIYAANQRVPMLGLSYDPKIDQFLKRIEAKVVGTTNELESKEFVEQMGNILDHRDQWLEQRSRQIQTLKEQSQKPAQQISQFLRQNISR